MNIAPDPSTSAFPALPLAEGIKPERPSRVCIASFDFVGPVRNGGVGTAFTSLGEALAAAGNDVTFLFLAGRWCENRTLEHWIEEYRKKGIKFVPMPESGLRFETPWHIAKAYEAYLWLKEQGFDVVHFSEWKGPGYFSLLAKHQSLAFDRTLLCVHTHGPTLWHKLSNGEYVTHVDDVHMDYLECRSVQMAEVLVSPSQYLLRWILERNWTLPEKTFVQPYVRPATARQPLPDADRVHQIKELVFFGRLEVRKGLVLFCDALDQLKNDPQLRNASITFLGKADKIGNRSSADYVADRAKSWPWKYQLISDRDQAGAMDYLQSPGRLAVLPSLVDNLPNTVLECLGAKVPFIASNAGGIPEMIVAADLEATCFPLNARAFAEKLRHVLLNGICPATPAWDSQENESAWVKWHENQLAAQPTLLASISLELSVANPLVSICMSHWNRPHYLKQALVSIEAMDYPNYEVVLVDDGSTQPEALKLIDELTPEFARRGWQLLRNSENRYPGAARNLAVRHARGEYVMLMDDDNCAKPHELSTFVNVARKTGADILTCCLDTFTGTDAPHAQLAPRSRWVFVGDDAATGAIRNCFGDTNSLIRREVFLSLGGFHEDWGVGHEDWEFFAKAVLRGFKLEVVPEALAWYRLNEAEQTVNRKTPLHRNRMANIRPYLEAVPPGLKNLVYLAQGQDLLLAHSAGATGAADPAETKLTVAWHAKVESARMFAKLKQKTVAIDLLVEAIKTVEVAKRPLMLFETLLTVGQEMQNLDQQRAQQIFRIAMQLAKALKNDSMEQAAAKFIATPASAKTKSATTPLAPVKASTPKATPTQPVPSAASTTLVSIVIPVFNNLALTRGCLESLARTPVETKYEIIVVDNASTDGTAEFLNSEASAGHIRVITNSQNEGFARACNLGAQTAQGSLLLFLNNDTKVTDGWLDALVQAAQQPIVGVVGAKLLYADNRIQHAGIEFINDLPDHPHRHAPADAPAANQFRELDMVTGACFMIHRELFLQLAGFDEVYRNGVEDVDLCLRARAAGQKVVYEPKAVVYHLEGQSAGRFDHVKENLTLFFERWGKSFDGKKRFVTPKFAKVFPASRSVLLPENASLTNKLVSVAWEGSFLDFGSLSHVNRELTRELSVSKQIRLQCVNLPASQDGAATPKELKKFAATLATKSPVDTQITIRHAWPPNWQRPAQGKLVVIQPWEFGSLPQDWVEQSKNVDEFWVPSNYVRKVYTDSGIESGKVMVVPNGIDPERFRPDATPRKFTTTKSFKFLFVGGTIPRKGIDVLLHAFAKTFTASDDVALVIKDFGGNTVYKGQTWGERIAEIQRRPNAPEIIYLDNEFAPEDLPGLYTACDCLVHPYRGEGFGLPVIEAMACGLPVVVTAGGATDDFATDEFAWRIPATRRVIGREVGGMKLATEAWLLEPDANALSEKMKWITANLEAARAKGRAASEHARRNWTWKNAAETAIARLQQLAAVPAIAPQPKPATPELPVVAKIGNLKAARELFGQKKFAEAWESTLAEIHARPFHPEAFLLLAEIALAAGDASSARQCAEHARLLAPNWDKPKQFLKKPLKGDAKLEWLQPSSILHPPSSPRLTVCLIAKNEEKFLGQCLKSIHGLAQQIIVVDTGSTDRTVEIAKEHGAEVHSFAWCDDFSAARNATLAHATGDWILMLDADEELPADQHAKLLADLKTAKVIAHRLPLANVGQNDGQSFVPRLFRNAPGVYFHGRIHEQVFPSLVALGKTWGLDTTLGTAQILHHGYSKEVVQDRNKIERNLKLLRQAIEENPGDANLAMNFGLELVRSGDLTGGIVKYREALRLMSAQKPGDVVPELREVLLTQFTSHLYKTREHEEVVRTLSSPLAKNGDLTASLHFALGLSNFELKNYRETAEQMRQCLAKRNQTALSPINTDTHTCAPNHCLALSLAKLGDHAGAEKAFQAAVSETGRVEDVKLDYAKFLAGQNRQLDALHKLNEIIAQNSRNAAAWKLGGEIALNQPDFLEFACDWTGEATRHLAEDIAITAQRAEVLLLSGDTASAHELWERIYNTVAQGNQQAHAISTPSPRPSGERAGVRGTEAENNQPPHPNPLLLLGGEGARTRALAALILCESLEAQTTHAPDEGAQETQTSREFIAWYQKLLTTKTQTVISRLNDQTEKLSRALPTAAGIIEKALYEANQSQLVPN